MMNTRRDEIAHGRNPVPRKSKIHAWCSRRVGRGAGGGATPYLWDWILRAHTLWVSETGDLVCKHL